MPVRACSAPPHQGEYTAIDGWASLKLLELKAEGVALPSTCDQPFHPVVPAPTGSGVMLLFPGQGAQKVGMVTPYVAVPGVKEMFDDAKEILGYDLFEVRAPARANQSQPEPARAYNLSRGARARARAWEGATRRESQSDDGV